MSARDLTKMTTKELQEEIIKVEGELTQLHGEIFRRLRDRLKVTLHQTVHTTATAQEVIRQYEVMKAIA